MSTLLTASMKCKRRRKTRKAIRRYVTLVQYTDMCRVNFYA